MATNGSNDAPRVATDRSTSNSNSATSSPSPSRSAGQPQQQQQPQQHRPVQPSGLRHSHMPPSSPEAMRSHPDVTEAGVESLDHANADAEDSHQEAAQDGPDAQTSLLANYGAATVERQNGAEPYIFRHRPRYAQGYGSFASSYAPTEAGSFEQRPSLGGGFLNRNDHDEAGIAESMPDSVTDGLLGRPKKRGTTHWLARMGGIKSERMMYMVALADVSCSWC